MNQNSTATKDAEGKLVVPPAEAARPVPISEFVIFVAKPTPVPAYASKSDLVNETIRRAREALAHHPAKTGLDDLDREILDLRAHLAATSNLIKTTTGLCRDQKEDSAGFARLCNALAIAAKDRDETLENLHFMQQKVEPAKAKYRRHLSAAIDVEARLMRGEAEAKRQAIVDRLAEVLEPLLDELAACDAEIAAQE